MKNALRLLSALALPAALGLAGAAIADPMAAEHPMSAAPMAAGHPMGASAMASDAMAAPASTGAMAGH